MTIEKLDTENISTKELEELLSLFINSYSKDDYMASREVTDLDTLRGIIENKNLVHFIAYEENIPLAYCQIMHMADSVNFNSGAKINAVAVLPNKRGLGIGTRLLQTVIDYLKSNPKIRNIHLGVASANTGAKEIYKKLGFVKVGELQNTFRKDDVLMSIEMYSLLT
jgi:ribosomal protein S18 acetylase RimI-like enzyme